MVGSSDPRIDGVNQGVNSVLSAHEVLWQSDGASVAAVRLAAGQLT